MNVLSLFDGISVAQLALERAGIKVDKYFASEIDKHAIAVTQHRFPNTVQLGDVCKWETWDLPRIDLIIGGSPCQGFSFSGKGLNFNDPRSKLFFKFAEVLEAIGRRNVSAFVLENVVMKQEYQDVISMETGVDPIMIDSNLVSAQHRKRLYWIGKNHVQKHDYKISTYSQVVIPQPKDKGITLHDILDRTQHIAGELVDTTTLGPAAIRGRYINPGTIVGRRLDNSGKRQDYDKKIPISQCLEVRAANTTKSNCITTVDKDNVLTSLPIGRYPDAFKDKLPFRYYTTVELHRLQTLPDDWCSAISDSQARKALGNCFTCDVIAHILTHLK